MSFHTVDHDQGSIAWHRWRRDGIGGSDAPALMGENPWRSAKALFAEKIAPSRFGPAPATPPPPRQPPHADLFAAAARPPLPSRSDRSATSRGTALEPYARDLYNAHVGGALAPMCLQSTDIPWRRASLDGFCAATSRALEIKCGDKVYAHVEATGRVPAYYIGQLQQILAITSYAVIDFWVWLPGRTPLLLTVPRDEAYIATLTATGAEFWARVLAARAI